MFKSIKAYFQLKNSVVEITTTESVRKINDQHHQAHNIDGTRRRKGSHVV